MNTRLCGIIVEVLSGPPYIVNMKRRSFTYLIKVARYSFSWSIPPKFVYKLRRHKQTFGKITTTVVLDNDGICYDQGYNDIGVVIATK